MSGASEILQKKKGNLDYFNNLVKQYSKLRAIKYTDSLEEFVQKITAATNDYLDCFWPAENNPFSHQADFVSSILPEALCLIFNEILTKKESMKRKRFMLFLNPRSVKGPEQSVFSWTKPEAGRPGFHGAHPQQRRF